MKSKYQPKIRVFAGPNGSGKSKLKSSISSILGSDLIGIYINPDEIEKNIKTSGFIDFKEFRVETVEQEIFNHLQQSLLLKEKNLIDEIKNLTFADQKLGFAVVKINSYFASTISDFIRNKLLEKKESFSFETVMSSSDKIEFLKKANQLGYKTYVYFIATKDPMINISRIKQRRSQGGHDVPEDKVISRYYRSLDLLIEAVRNSWRTYVFDNSTSQELIAESQGGKIIELKSATVPTWFARYVIKKISK